MDKSSITWLMVILLIVVLILVIVIAIGMFKVEKKNDTLSFLRDILNPSFKANVPIIAKNKQYDTQIERQRTSGNLFLKDVEQTKTINIDWLKNIALDTGNDNWFVKEVFLPKTMAYALALTNLKRNEDVEKLLAEYIKTYPNPKIRSNDTTKPESLSYMYSKISYHMIWYKYVEKHSLQSILPYNSSMKNTLDVYLKDFWLSKTITDFNGQKITDGQYYYAVTQEIGYVENEGVPNGGNLIYLIIEAAFFIQKFYDYNKLRTACALLFDRVRSNVHDTFVRLAGTEKTIVRLEYLANWLKCMTYLYGVNKNNHIGQEYYNQLTNIPDAAKVHYFPTDYPGQKVNSDIIVRSLSEGFFYLNQNKFTFEQAVKNDVYNYETPGMYIDDLKFNLNQMKGYFNYGCDFASVFRHFNTEDNKNFLLAGQYMTIPESESVASVLNVPNCGALVPLPNDRFYVSHYNDPNEIQSHGLIDTKDRIHKYSVANKSKIRYCVFAWASQYYISTTKINDSTWVVYDNDKVFTIQVDAPLKLAFEIEALVLKGSYVKLIVELEANSTTNIVVSQSDVLTLTNVPELKFGIPSGVTFEPESVETAKLSHFEIDNKIFIINSQVQIDEKTPKIATYNTINYPFKNLSFNSFAELAK